MNYVQYQPFIQLISKEQPKIDAYVPENIFHAQQIGFEKLQTYILQEYQEQYKCNNVQEKFNHNELKQINMQWILNKLKLDSEDELLNLLSIEQIDSVCAAIFNIENHKEFIIGDDTGVGKGRILAAIVRYALINKDSNMNVIFFTEGSHLFSDFWRDLANLNITEQLDTFILHGNGKVYDQQGNKIAQSFNKTIMKEMLDNGKFQYHDKKQKKDIQLNTNLILTTYSQFNRIVTAKDKIKLIKHYIQNKKKTIVLFDEFHNSIGDSTTKDMKDKILSLDTNGQICSIYSSATFLDNFSQIMSFKNMLDLSDNDFKVIQHLEQETQTAELKNQIAYYFTSNMMLLRREHEAAQKTNYVEIDQQSKQKLNNLVVQYNKIIGKLFDCYQVAEKISKNSNFGFAFSEKQELKNKWIALGAKINRLNKILLLLGKKEYLVNQIQQTLNEDKKVVIILDSTFESILQNVMEFEKSVLINDTPLNPNQFKHLNMKTLIKEIIHNIFSGDGKKNAINFFAINNKTFNEAYNHLMDEVDNFPELDLSFIDQLKQHFNDALEISGRSFSIKKNDNDGLYEKVALNKIDKPIATYQFNNQTDKNIIILTRSGSTGLSLHAYNQFKDQRVRKMFEPEITPRVKVRKQFFGRINRRNQVVKPEFESISSGLPFEKRIIALEEQKFKDMKAFIGSDYEIQSLDYDYYNDDINILAKIYLMTNPIIAKKLGITLYSTQTSESYYFIDSLLKRSILLTEQEQEDFFNFLDIGHDYYARCFYNYHTNIRQSFVENIMFHKFYYLWGDKNCNQLSNKEKLDTVKPYVALVETFNEKKLNNITQEFLKNKLLQHYHDFDNQYYQNKLEIMQSHLVTMYNDKKIHENFNLMKQLTIGKQIQFRLNKSLYSGYVENIEINDEYCAYSTHYLYTIRLINPKHVNEYNCILSETILITGNVLLENENFKIFHQKIDFNKYARSENDIIKQKMFYLVGNMFYINYFSYLYNIGEEVLIHKNIDDKQKQIFAVKLPNNLTKEKIQQLFLQKPLLSLSELETCIKNNPNLEIETHDKQISILFEKHPTNFNLNTWMLKIHKDIYLNDNVLSIMDRKIIKDSGGIYKQTTEWFYIKIDKYMNYKKILYALFIKPSIVFMNKEKNL